MLKLSPRAINVILVALFVSFFGVQHAIYSLSLTTDAPTARTAQDYLDRASLLAWVERQDFDLHLRKLRSLARHPDVTIVEVNERSVLELGQFPFPRRIYRDLLRKLEAYGAKVVAFDITYPEREENGALKELRAALDAVTRREGVDSPTARFLAARIVEGDGDHAFAEGLKETKLPVVLGFAFAGQGVQGKSLSPRSLELLRRHDLFRRQVQDNSFLHAMGNRAPVLPHDELVASLNEKSSLGSFTADPDDDSVIRRAAAVIGYDNMLLPSLAVRAVAAYLGVEPSVNGENGLRLEDKEQTGALSVPLTPTGSALLRYYGEGYTFPYVEFADVIAGRADPAKLKGKIIFVGATAEGLKDLRASPLSNNYPGVEVHATFASNMLKHDFLEKDGRYYLAGYAFTLFLLLSVSFFVYRLQPLLAFGLSLAVLAGFQYAAQVLCYDAGLVVPTLVPSFGAVVALFAGVLYRYFTEEREKRMVRTAFSRYVSGAVVSEILKDPSKLKLGGQKKVLTVMFCDLVGFTKLSENLDAGMLTQLLNEYFTRMTAIILRNHGTLDKYMGDAVMCFWGAPLDLPGHAAHACRTALEMMEELARINIDWHERHGLTVGCRIGLHTGEMAVGNLGSEQVFSYTVMGDNVNLGSRLEGVNNVYGTSVLVSAATRDAAGPGFRFRPLDQVRVKGKEEAVEILELLGGGDEPEPEWIHAFSAGLAAYRAGRWDEAEAAFGTCLSLRPTDGPATEFLRRVRDLKHEPPAAWDGVWKLTAK